MVRDCADCVAIDRQLLIEVRIIASGLPHAAVDDGWLQQQGGDVRGGHEGLDSPSDRPGEDDMDTETIARQLVDFCRKGQYEDAQKALYGDDAVSIEPEGLPPGALGTVRGLDAIFEKGRKFSAGIEAVHATEVSDPLVAGNWFSVRMRIDVTMKGMGRMDMQEICVYGVRDGKIVHEQFFYDAG